MMPTTCILTDSSVQLVNSHLEGCENLIVLPHYVYSQSQWQVDSPELLPHLVSMEKDTSQLTLRPPSIEDFQQMLGFLNDRYHHILVLLPSSHLSQAYQNACQAAAQLRGAATVQVIDSQTIGAGLGMLVEAAAEAIEQGMSAIQVNRLVRGLIPHVYTILCLQSLRHLSAAGHLDPAQAAIGEMLGIIPFYVLDNGKLVPIQKARSTRQMLDVLYEFVTEFERVEHIALLRGPTLFEQETHNLSERLSINLPDVPISEHTFGAGLTVLFGPRSFGITVLEHKNEL